jgi:hypothetical protein
MGSLPRTLHSLGASMLFIKIIVLLMFGLILFSLSKGLFFLLNNKSSVKMAKALTWRVSLSLGVFAFLLLAFVFGWIKPHGFIIKPTPLNQDQAKLSKQSSLTSCI